MSFWTDRTIAEKALCIASSRTWPTRKVRTTLECLARWYGDDWLEQAESNGHPVAALTYFPGLKWVCQLVDLMAFTFSGKKQSSIKCELLHRFRKADWRVFWSLFEELRVMWSLEQGPFSVTKVSEQNEERTPDLRITLDDGSSFFAEVTVLESTENHRRMGRAWGRLSCLGRCYKRLEVAMILQNRAYSERHIDDLEQQLLSALNEATQSGMAKVAVPGVIRYVCWREDFEKEAEDLLDTLGMEKTIQGGVIDWPSRIAPFRIVQKINDKAHQVPQDSPWLLVIGAPERVWRTDDIREIDREAVEYVYDHPSLIGVLLYHQWGIAHLNEMNEDYRGVSVRTNFYDNLEYQQTILLKNRYSSFEHKQMVWAEVLKLGQFCGWQPTFP